MPRVRLLLDFANSLFCIDRCATGSRQFRIQFFTSCGLLPLRLSTSRQSLTPNPGELSLNPLFGRTPRRIG